MSANEVAEYVKNLGFPIAMCVIIYVDLRKQIVALTDAVKQLLAKVS